MHNNIILVTSWPMLQSLDYEVMDSELYVKEQKETSRKKLGNVSCSSIKSHFQ